MTKTPYNFVSDERFQQLSAWLTEQGFSVDSLSPMSADAGFRRYFRLQIDGGTLVAVDAPPEHEDTASFLKVSNTLKNCGLITPHVHCYNLENGFMLLSDLGSLHLQDAATNDHIKSAQSHYMVALQTLIRMQSDAPAVGLPVYTADFLMQELTLFPQWYLHRHLQNRCSSETKKQLKQCFDLCIDSALEQPQVFVHRDYHCRNLMIQSDGSMAIIDFQGAVKGPVTYDLVSLLKDAYVEWPESFLNPLLKLHHSTIHPQKVNHPQTAPSYSTYRRWFDLMGLQRHLKILGLFCRLHYRDAKSHYLHNIPLVRKHVENVCLNYPEFSALHDLLLQSSAVQE